MFDESQLAALPVDVKLRLVTSLWDQIASSKTPIALPESVLDDADRKINDMMSDRAATLTEEEMWRRANALR